MFGEVTYTPVCPINWKKTGKHCPKLSDSQDIQHGFDTVVSKIWVIINFVNNYLTVFYKVNNLSFGQVQNIYNILYIIYL